MQSALLATILADLEAEGDDLDRLVASLPDAGWRRPTPAPGWTVAHQIAHLAWADEQALLAGTDPPAFTTRLAALSAGAEGLADETAAEGVAAGPAVVLGRWRVSRADLLRLLGTLPAGTKLPWFGPAMSRESMATARLMETWAHGLDVADALGVSRAATHRLRHIAHLGVRTRDFSFAVRGLPPPDAPFRVELAAPDGTCWAWGPANADDRVEGSALDFCLLVTQRRHRDDLDLRVTGEAAERWVGVAQAFAGPPGSGRPRVECAGR